MKRRRSPATALFPYVTEDKVLDSVGVSGPVTSVLAGVNGRLQLWRPLRGDDGRVYRIVRRLYRNVLWNRLVLEEENHGLFPSVLASKPAVKEALSKGDRFVMETDFLDEPSRPGAVMRPTTDRTPAGSSGPQATPGATCGASPCCSRPSDASWSAVQSWSCR